MGGVDKMDFLIQLYQFLYIPGSGLFMSSFTSSLLQWITAGLNTNAMLIGSLQTNRTISESKPNFLGRPELGG